MTVCPNCGFQLSEALNFCPKCGYSLKGPASIPPPPQFPAASPETQETGFYKGEGNMAVKTIKKQGVAVKVGVW